MTLRAVLLGLLAVVFLCSATYFNDNVLGQTHLVGNHMPISAFGGLLLFLLCLNPLLVRLGKGASLRGKELAVIMMMVLAASTIPSSGMMRTFTTSLMMPHHHNKTSTGWQRHELVKMMPEQMLADPGEGDRALNQFIQGMGRADRKISLSQVPWGAWTKALFFWMPLIGLLYFAMIGLALVVHRQWSDHEQLPYPLARFVNALLPEKPGLAKGPVFSEKLFWIGFVLVTLIHLNNYAYVWFPSLVAIPTFFNFTSLFEGLPAVQAEGLTAYEFRIYFSMIAVAYFLASDVGLAIGVAPLLYPFVAAFFTSQGIALKGGGYQAPERFVVAGAFFGMFTALVYTGRNYYLATFKKAFGGKGEGSSSESVWGARLFVLAISLFACGLVYAGLDWILAALLALTLVVLYLVMGRIIAETGLFFLQPWWLPGALFIGLLGPQALKPEAVIILFFVSVIFAIDPREAIMPFLINAFKLVDLRGVSVGRSASLAGLALMVGLAVAVPATLYFQYNHGARMSDTHATSAVPKTAFEETMKVAQRLEAQGLSTFEATETKSTKTVGIFSPDRTLVTSFGVGIGLTLLFTFGRLRFANWPIHPVFFVIFCSFAGAKVAFSFLLGWMIKKVTTKYGGEHGYHVLRPLMFGLIAGDLLGGGIPILVGWLYYFVTGELPRPFNIFPG